MKYQLTDLRVTLFFLRVFSPECYFFRRLLQFVFQHCITQDSLEFNFKYFFAKFQRTNLLKHEIAYICILESEL